MKKQIISLVCIAILPSLYGQMAQSRYDQVKRQAQSAKERALRYSQQLGSSAAARTQIYAQKAGEFAKAHKKELITGAVAAGVAGLALGSRVATRLNTRKRNIETELKLREQYSINVKEGWIPVSMQAAIYAMKKSGFNNEQIGLRFRLSPDSVAKVVKAVEGTVVPQVNYDIDDDYIDDDYIPQEEDEEKIRPVIKQVIKEEMEI